MPEAEKTDWSKTVNLPKTSFPMKGELPKREPGLLRFWDEGKVYERLLKKNEGRPRFVLHDGPPYANGHIHIGHALNKILKDVVAKMQAMSGRWSPYVPGWDCHGLPIEHQLLKDLGLDKRQVTDIAKFRRQAEDFARRFIDIQKAEFRRLGLFGDWSAPYTTMSSEYEAAVIRAFRVLLNGGYIYRGRKPVYWCFHCETALAEAEVEYKDKTSPSIYVLFPVKELPAGHPWKTRPGEKLYALAWTTTPWTLPANAGLAFHPDLEYVRVQAEAHMPPGSYIVAKARREALIDDLSPTGGLQIRKDGVEAVSGKSLEGLVAETVLGGREVKGVLATYVTTEDGSGIVHTAPGHGREDFETGLKNKLPVLSPVDAGGKFTAEASKYQGQHILKANPVIIEDLRNAGRLVKASELAHGYPHCWRCKNPVIYRATEQWFLSVEHQGLRAKLLNSIGEVKWVPEVGRARISAMVESRPDWCISRQRFWGTPIPILYCAAGRHPVADNAVLTAIEQRVASQGSDFWFSEMSRPVLARDLDKLGPEAAKQVKAQLPPGVEPLVWDFLPEDTACKKCGSRAFHRELDILDVWVDSGASWLGVLKGLDAYPAQLYLEGSDQHRGWFQSSLVLSVAMEGRAPYEQVLTHGFVLDDQGRAMHKSLGNVVSPQTVVDQYGADILRLWVALSDYSEDVRLSAKLLEGPIDTYRKVRNTLRYLLGNTFDFDPDRDAAPYAEMLELDRFALHRLAGLVHEVEADYTAYRFRGAAKSITEFCINDLSSFYLDVLKDRLYTSSAKSRERRSGQTALWEISKALTRLLAPVLSFTAEEAWQALRAGLAERGAAASLEESVFLAGFPEVHEDWFRAELELAWRKRLDVRSRVQLALEHARREGLIGSSLEAKVLLRAGDAETRGVLEGARELWASLAIVSQAEVESEPAAAGQDLEVRVLKAEGRKCPRCWQWRRDVGAEHPELCSRCARAVA